MTAIRVNLGSLPRDLTAASLLLRNGTRDTVHRTGAAALTNVRAKASTGNHPPGRPHIPGTGPGPNVATGDYRRSMTLTTPRVPSPGGGSMPSALVFTNAVQANRLERGYVDTDAAGRHVRQQPYPHWGPMADEMEAAFTAAMTILASQVTSALGGRG